MTGRPALAMGVDGCRSGWVVASARAHFGGFDGLRVRVVGALDELLAESPAVIAADVPIGLPERAEPGGRACDRAARAELGPRKASVFSPPVRAVLGCATYEEALGAMRASSEHGIGLSKQSWNIVPKVREADAFVIVAERSGVRVVECHPELCFTRITGAPMHAGKKSPEGRRARLASLGRVGLVWSERPRGALHDDVIDALACLWTARRVARGDAQALGPEGGARIWV